MKVCPTCNQCYDDDQAQCAWGHHQPLADEYPGPRLIGGKYRLDRMVGRGSVGSLYAATTIESNLQIAIKLVRSELLSHPLVMERFHREAAIAARIHHPSIVAIRDFGVLPGGTAYIGMELVQGPTLRQWMRNRGHLEVGEALIIARQIGTAMEAAHQEGVVHRDLSPSNIMLTCTGDGQLLCKVVDFGIAQLKDYATPIPHTKVAQEPSMGTPGYASPEQCRQGIVDARSDIYSLGVILYEMLAGHRPAERSISGGGTGEPVWKQAVFLEELPPHVAQPLGALIDEALQADPRRRIQSAEALVNQIVRIEAAIATAPRVRSPLKEMTLAAEASEDRTIELGEAAVLEGTAEIHSSTAVPASIAERVADSRKSQYKRGFHRSSAAVALLVAISTWGWLYQDRTAPERKHEPKPAETRAPIADPMETAPVVVSIPSADSPHAESTLVAPASSADDEAQHARDTLMAALDEWVSSTNTRDFDKQRQFYPQRMEAFYLWRDVPRSAVLAEKRKVFERAEVIDIETKAPQISFDSSGSARMLFEKRYLIKGDKVDRQGTVLQELRWVNTGSQWQIVSERDLRVIS